MGGGVGGI